MNISAKRTAKGITATAGCQTGELTLKEARELHAQLALALAAPSPQQFRYVNFRTDGTIHFASSGIGSNPHINAGGIKNRNGGGPFHELGEGTSYWLSSPIGVLEEDDTIWAVLPEATYQALKKAGL